jgi:hypothetical protein
MRSTGLRFDETSVSPSGLNSLREFSDKKMQSEFAKRIPH